MLNSFASGFAVGVASEVTAALLTGEASAGETVVRSGVQRGLFSIVMGRYLGWLNGTFSSALPMLAFDQLIATWFVNFAFVGSHAVLVQKKPFSELSTIAQNMPGIVKSAIICWTPANAISLFLIPPQYRLYWGLLIGYFWGCYISVRAARRRKQAKK